MLRWKKDLKLTKHPDEVLDIDFDWSDVLASGENISTSTITVDSGLTLNSDTNTSSVTTGTISGGTLYNVYRFESKITTSAGLTYVRSILIKMAQK